jgi:SAM-dependent methyltransferase
MSDRDKVDLFDSTYGNFGADVLAAVRRETFGEDIGQNSWLLRGEFDAFLDALALDGDAHLLEVASGSGGPALYAARRTGARVTGVDANAAGVAEATAAAARAGLADRATFRVADATAPLPFADGAFDALTCIDSMNHFPDRAAVLGEWARVLRPGGRAVFTDPVVITGPVTSEELAIRAAVGLFLFVPPGVTEDLIEGAGLRLVERKDVSAAAAHVAGNWAAARSRHREELVRLEGEERFEGLQGFFQAVRKLTGDRRLTRIAYFVEKGTPS